MVIDAGEPLGAGDSVGSYVIDRLIGMGRSNAVYAARHKPLNKAVALRLLRRELAGDKQAVLRSSNAARALSRINNEGVATVYDYGQTEEGIPYMVMELVDGQSLKLLLANGGALAAPRLRRIFGQIAMSMTEVHKQGMVHCDLRPANFIVGKPPGEKVKIIDFDYCRTVSRAGSMTSNGELTLNPAYMSPEQCLGRPLDARSDIYSLGCSMFEAMTGNRPLEGDTAIDTMIKQLSELPRVPKGQESDYKGLSAVILKCLQKDPADRYQDMPALRRELVGDQVQSKMQKGFRNLFG